MSLGLVVSRNRTAILGLTALLAAAGLWAARRMPLAIFPEVAFHRIAVIAHAGHLPVERRLTTVTQPLEAALNHGGTGLEAYQFPRPTRGGVQIDLTYAWSTGHAADPYSGCSSHGGGPAEPSPGGDMEARLLDTSGIPDRRHRRHVARARRSRDVGLRHLRGGTPVPDACRGVYRVELSGAKILEYALTVDPVALVQHRLDLASVGEAVRRANVIAAGGEVRDGYRSS